MSRPVVAVVVFQGLHGHAQEARRIPRLRVSLHEPSRRRVSVPVWCDLRRQASVLDAGRIAATDSAGDDRAAVVENRVAGGQTILLTPRHFLPVHRVPAPKVRQQAVGDANEGALLRLVFPLVAAAPIDHTVLKIHPGGRRASRSGIEREPPLHRSKRDHLSARLLGLPRLSQLNRTVEQSGAKDKRPNLSSIKDSGAIVEDARQVILLYRPEYYFREPFEHESMEAKAERLAELEKVRNHYYWIVEKNSNGPRFQTLTYCKADCAAVRDWNI